MLFESLDARRLFASLAGSVFTDADSSTTFDTGEKGLSGLTVFLDANANGRFDRGEASTTTDKGGFYRFKDLARGTYNVSVVAPADVGQTTPGRLGSSAGGFDIVLSGIESLEAPIRRAFEAAAAKWESVIVGDLPNSFSIDDVRIMIDVERIDGPGGTLAQSGPERTRAGSDLPITGSMEFDRSDVDDLLADGTLVYTITHEMAHVLGFGTIWADRNLIAGEGTRSSRFTGRQAVAAYKEIFGINATSIPLETGGGDGTADSHWPERAFNVELMTGYAEGAGIVQPLSRITAASMADLGYTVALPAADAWTPESTTGGLTTPLALGVRSFQRRVTLAAGSVDVANLNFGYRANTAPAIGTFTAANGTLGQTTTLTARNITDAEGDAVVGVSFYGESNGIAGLQPGRGGDAYLGGVATASGNAWSVVAPTTALAAGQQTYYAIAQDELGSATRRSTIATLVAPPPPTRPNPVSVARVSSTEAIIGWRDRSADEIGFRVEILDDSGAVVRTANVPANSRERSFAGLTHLAFYTARVRSYGYGGASAYTRTERFRV